MSEPKYTKVLTDTCFLISLLNENDAQHKHAEEYFRYFIEQKTQLYLSTISLSECYEKQQPTIIRNFKLVSFGLNESTMQHDLFQRSDVQSKASEEKIVVKDDIKIISSAVANKIPNILSVNDDFCKMAQKVSLNVIDYRVDLSAHLGKLPLPPF